MIHAPNCPEEVLNVPEQCVPAAGARALLGRGDLPYRAMDYAAIRSVLCVNRILWLWKLLVKACWLLTDMKQNGVSHAGRHFLKHSPSWWYV